MHVCIHICAMHTYMQQAPERAPLHIQESPTVRILAGVGARRWTQITSRLLAVPGTRPPAISTRKRSVSSSCSSSRNEQGLYCGFCPLLLFNKLERNDENRANFQGHRRIELFEMEILAASLILRSLSGFSGVWLVGKGLKDVRGMLNEWTNSMRSWSKMDSMNSILI